MERAELEQAALAKVREYLDAGYTVSTAYKLFGVHRTTLTNLVKYEGKTLLPVTLRHIASAPPPPPPPDVVRYHGRLSAIGSMRRLRALAATGYGLRDIESRASCGYVTLALLRSGARTLVTPGIAREIDKLYQRLSATPGKSMRAILKARREGWPPPLAYEDWELDDPDPEVDRRAAERVLTDRERRKLPPAEELVWLIRIGETLPAIAQRFDVKLETVKTALTRAGWRQAA